MTEHAEATTFADAVRVGADAGVLARIGGADVALAIWRRRLPCGLAQWLDTLPYHALPTASCDLEPADAPHTLHAAFDTGNTQRSDWRNALVADIAELVRRFAAIGASPRVRLRLEAVDGDACRRFHRDCLPLRLLCTYRGPGTDWVAPAWSGQALAAPDDYAGPLSRLASHDVAVFKGCGFPGAVHDAGIVHRSPPIAGTGITRLVLRLDPLQSAAP